MLQVRKHGLYRCFREWGSGLALPPPALSGLSVPTHTQDRVGCTARALLTLASLLHFTGPGFILTLRTKPYLGCRRKGSSFNIISPSLAGIWL